MPDPNNPKRERSPLVIAAAIVVPLLPVLYVLSYGPMFLLIRWGLIEEPYTFVNWFYAPLDYLCYKSKTFNDLLYWYARLWGAG